MNYFTNESEQTARGTIQLKDGLVSNITLIKERAHSFSIQCAPQPQGKTIFFSCNSMEESEEW